MSSDTVRAIFITGAASGMGLATAELFHERGWMVGAFDVNAAGLDALADRLGSERLTTGLLDVADHAAFERTMGAFVEKSGGRLDLMFNNAGIGGRFGPMADMTYDEMMRLVQINFVGVLNGVYAALPHLRLTPNALCLTTSSSSATFGRPGAAVYSACKKGLKGLTEALSIEFEALGCRCADIIPHMTDTALVPDAMKQSARASGGDTAVIAPREIAELAWRAYHEEERVHWYIPARIYDEDVASTVDPVAMRADFKAKGVFDRFISVGPSAAPQPVAE